MASNPPIDPIPAPDLSESGPGPGSSVTPEKENPDKHGVEHLETGGAPVHGQDGTLGIKKDGNIIDAHNNTGMAVIEQRGIIPSTGRRIPTTKLEYALFCVFYFSLNGAPIGGNGGALRQALLNQKYPDGYLQWGGQYLPINSMLLDVTGVLFAAQLVTLLIIGPYADYGNWRPWIMIVGQTILYICQFAMCGISKPEQWEIAQALYVVGSIAANVVNSFYAATFPSLVRDLPKLIRSEKDVMSGNKSPDDHAELDSYERSKLYNLVNITGSGLVVITYAIAVGISAGIGFGTPQRLIYSYQVLMGYFGAITVICTLPFFLVHKHRPGQQLPAGSKWWSAGPKQVWSAAKSATHLKQCMLYLVAYFMLQETFGTYFNVTGILQNEVINYSPLQLNAMSLVADLSGGSGTVFMLWLQKKYRFTVKQGVFYGACMTLIPSLWGAIGTFQQMVGFHHIWEFWLAQAWNFQTAAWGSYQVTMISEVVPAPKAYMFFALFNTVGKTSGFIGPFISSAIIKRAGGNTNASYWFLWAMGTLGVIVLYFVDTDKAKIDNAKYLEREAQELYTQEQREQNQFNQMEDDAEVEKKVVS